MYKSFDEALHALLRDKDLHAAGGGQILKHTDGFIVRLFDQPVAEVGELFFELNPSVVPGETWKWMGVSQKAREAYYAFIQNPDNGSLIPSK